MIGSTLLLRKLVFNALQHPAHLLLVGSKAVAFHACQRHRRGRMPQATQLLHGSCCRSLLQLFSRKAFNRRAKNFQRVDGVRACAHKFGNRLILRLFVNAYPASFVAHADYQVIHMLCQSLQKVYLHLVQAEEIADINMLPGDFAILLFELLHRQTVLALQVIPFVIFQILTVKQVKIADAQILALQLIFLKGFLHLAIDIFLSRTTARKLAYK